MGENLKFVYQNNIMSFLWYKVIQRARREMPTIHKHKGLLILIDIDPNKQIVMLRNFSVSLSF